MSVTEWVKVGAVVGGVYLLPKALGFLTTRPDDHESSLSPIGQMRMRFANVRDFWQDALGEKIWFCTTQVIGDNGWVATIALICLHRHFDQKTITFIHEAATTLSPSFLERMTLALEKTEKSVSFAGIFFAFATSSCVFRKIAVWGCPKLGDFL